MSVDASRFGDGSVETTLALPVIEKIEVLSTWQIDVLRAVLDPRGVASTDVRRRLSSEIVGRTVVALKDLTAVEADVLRDSRGKVTGSR